MDEREIITIDVPEEDSPILKLSRTYDFEGEMVSELDFSGLENLTVRDMKQAARRLTGSGNFAVVPEMDLQYCVELAAKATGRPIEFFDWLRPADGLAVKNKVTAFLFKRG